jgi:hypothetical protein
MIADQAVAARRARSWRILCRLPHRLIEHQVRDREREVSRYMTPQSPAAQARTWSGRLSATTASRAIVASIRSDVGGTGAPNCGARSGIAAYRSIVAMSRAGIG